MKNLIYYGKNLFILIYTIFSVFKANYASASTDTKDYIIVSPKVYLSGKNGASTWNVPLKLYTFDGKFNLLDGELDNISDFRFTLQLNDSLFNEKEQNLTICEALRLKKCSEITFMQTRLMILPIMKMVHLVGDTKITTGNHAMPIQFQYTFSEEGIHFFGKLGGFLSEFGLGNKKVVAYSEEDEVNIYFDFTIVKSK